LAQPEPFHRSKTSPAVLAYQAGVLSDVRIDPIDIGWQDELNGAMDL
jgi:hypothetical protein